MIRNQDDQYDGKWEPCQKWNRVALNEPGCAGNHFPTVVVSSWAFFLNADDLYDQDDQDDQQLG